MQILSVQRFHLPAGFGKLLAELRSSVRTLTLEGVILVLYEKIPAIFGACAAIILLGGILTLLTGFVPEQKGHTVQFPMNNSVITTEPEHVDLKDGTPDIGSWQVIVPLTPENLGGLGAESTVDPSVRTPFSFAPVFPATPRNGVAGLSSPDSSSDSLNTLDEYLAEGPHSPIEAAFLFASLVQRDAALDFPNLAEDAELLVCLAPVPVAGGQGAAVKAGGRLSSSLLSRAGEYREMVEQHAKRYNLSPDFVLAIMHTESSFDPQAVSRANALGLMQVVPATAGGEVHAYLNGAPGLPSASTLFDPATNINYGTTYLYLLGTRHLGGIKDQRSRMYCVIAAYNGGPTAIYKTFGNGDRRLAIEIINSMTPEQVHKRLISGLPSKETREYVVKVLASLEKFSALR